MLGKHSCTADNCEAMLRYGFLSYKHTYCIAGNFCGATFLRIRSEQIFAGGGGIFTARPHSHSLGL